MMTQKELKAERRRELEHRLGRAREVLDMYHHLQREFAAVRRTVRDTRELITTELLTEAVQLEGGEIQGLARDLMDASMALHVAADSLTRLWWDARRNESTV